VQRQFSNRGEALAEVTAARMLARCKAQVNSAFTARASGRSAPEQWFSHPVETVRQSKKKASEAEKSQISAQP
jgi:hypothetical protein